MTITELTEALAARKLRLPMDVESAGSDLLKAQRDATQDQDDMEERSFERTFGVNA